jgi:hypothetical protein
VILGLYAILSAALFYLGSRALITESVWRLYPARVARFMDCPACVGFWWGLIGHLVIGRELGVDIGPLPAQHVATPVIVGLCTLVLTPIVAGLMQHGLDLVGVAAMPSTPTPWSEGAAVRAQMPLEPPAEDPMAAESGVCTGSIRAQQLNDAGLEDLFVVTGTVVLERDANYAYLSVTASPDHILHATITRADYERLISARTAYEKMVYANRTQ